jgi:hypothetical protein
MTRIIVLCVALGAPVIAQQAPDQVTVAFSNPSTPGTLIVGLVQGSITVKGSNRKDVLIMARPRAESISRRSNVAASGLRRLTQSAGFKIEEQFNEMKVQSDHPNRAIDFEILAPARTHLQLSTVNSGNIVVEAIEGEIEVANTNGSITLTGVSGSVMAGTTNGSVRATLLRVAGQKPMAFTSLNGSVDVTLPSSTKANLRLRSNNGGVYSDFDVAVSASQPVVRDTRRERGRYEISMSRSINGTINGGGPEIELRTFNSNVYVRKGN